MHFSERADGPCNTERTPDPEQCKLDKEDAEARLDRLARCLAAEDAARETVRLLSQQLRNARCALRRAALQRAAVVAAEMRRRTKRA